MSKILDLRQKRSDVWDKAKAFLDEHSGENGLMSGEIPPSTSAWSRRSWIWVTPSSVRSAPRRSSES